MERFLPALIFLLLLTCHYANAGSSGYFELRGTTLKTSQLKLQTFRLSQTETEVLFSTQTNSKYSDESQKFEFEGDAEVKKMLKIKKISTNNRSSLYEIIITEKKHASIPSSPLFLKITAN